MGRPTCRLMTDYHHIGERAIEEPESHTRVAGVDEGALALYEDDLIALRRLENELLGSTSDEIGSDRIDRDPLPLDQDTSLTSRRKTDLCTRLDLTIPDIDEIRQLHNIDICN